MNPPRAKARGFLFPGMLAPYTEMVRGLLMHPTWYVETPRRLRNGGSGAGAMRLFLYS